MDTYDFYVQQLLDFLKSKNYGSSEICGHKRCLKELKAYLQNKNQFYSKKIADEWLKSIQDKVPVTTYSEFKKVLFHLSDLYETGKINESIYGWRTPPYKMLNLEFKKEIDDFISYYSKHNKKNTTDMVRFTCSRFLIFLQNNGLQNIQKLKVENVIRFFEANNYGKSSVEKRNIIYARMFLKYHAETFTIPEAFYISMDKKLVNHIIFLTKDEKEKFYKFESENFNLEQVKSFIIKIREIYSDTTRKSIIHDINAMYLFFYFNEIGYCPENVELWLSLIKNKINTGFKVWRRSVRLFQHFQKTGKINPEIIYTYYPDRLNSLPFWYSSVCKEYLTLRQREGLQKSSITMCRNCLVRFGIFLQKISISSFESITADVLTEFNLTDEHSTVEGKNAYNVRIRNFIEYLEFEKKIVSVKGLHKALFTATAPKIEIVKTLSSVNQKTIANFQQSSPMEARAKAMTYLGIYMGFRSSDIVNLKYTDIDWEHKTIRILQQKTQTEIVQPMPDIVGNAIHEYISTGRPYSTEPFIFIHHRVPYSKLHRSCCERALIKVVKTSDVNGFHITRKTFATNLLQSGTEINLVVNALGHQSNDTVGDYLNLNDEKMLLCTISLNEANIIFNGEF